MMKLYAMSAVSAAVLVASSAQAQTVFDTDLPNLNGNFGAGVATTTTTANGRTTTVTGPGGGANRATAAPNGSWFQANVGGGGTVGITKTYTKDGDGAAFFSTTSGDSKGDLVRLFSAPVALSALQSVSFEWYVDPATTTTNGPFNPVLRLEMRKNGAFAGQLILEHIYQNQTPPPEGVWTTDSSTLTSGIWWASNAALGPTFADANGGQKTLAQWIAGNAGSELTVVGVNIGVGSGWGGTFSGAIDRVNYAFTGGPSANVNFAVVPEPASWALMIAGFSLAGAAARRRTKGVAFA